MTGRRRRLLSGLALASACILSRSEAASAAEPEKRPVPDYDGRGDRPTSPQRALLWVPRVVLFPAYFVSEYLIRRPLGFVITAAEKAELPATLYDFFAFGPDHKSGVVPFGFIDLGFQPSIGLYGFWDDAGFEGHDLRIRGSTGGSDWLSFTLTERFRFSRRLDLMLTATARRRPDFAFYGVGPDTRESSLSRYSSDTLDARLQTRVGFGGSSWLETGSGYRGAAFGQGDHNGERTVAEAVRNGDFAEPPGFRDGYRAGFSRAKLVLDTRASEQGSATGGRVELEAEHGADLGRAPASGWLRYGGTLGGFLDLGDSGRVVGLSLTTLLADPLGSRPVPFTELVTLGGAMLTKKVAEVAAD